MRAVEDQPGHSLKSKEKEWRTRKDYLEGGAQSMRAVKGSLIAALGSVEGIQLKVQRL
jgi:hypothetical protein